MYSILCDIFISIKRAGDVYFNKLFYSATYYIIRSSVIKVYSLLNYQVKDQLLSMSKVDRK
jgi:hypothetical protein